MAASPTVPAQAQAPDRVQAPAPALLSPKAFRKAGQGCSGFEFGALAPSDSGQLVQELRQARLLQHQARRIR
jgi:hypothetical protein